MEDRNKGHKMDNLIKEEEQIEEENTKDSGIIPLKKLSPKLKTTGKTINKLAWTQLKKLNIEQFRHILGQINIMGKSSHLTVCSKGFIFVIPFIFGEYPSELL